MNIKVTRDEATMICYGLEAYATKLRDYADAYGRNGDRENRIDCIKEAGKYYDLVWKVRNQMVEEG